MHQSSLWQTMTARLKHLEYSVSGRHALTLVLDSYKIQILGKSWACYRCSLFSRRLARCRGVASCQNVVKSLRCAPRVHHPVILKCFNVCFCPYFHHIAHDSYFLKSTYTLTLLASRINIISRVVANIGV